MTRTARGDRNEAIRLLQKTNMTYKEIGEVTGVPYGSVAHMAAEYRPKDVRRMNSVKAGLENIKSYRESDGNASDKDNTPYSTVITDSDEEDKGNPEYIHLNFDSLDEAAVERHVNFSYQAKTKKPVSKVQLLDELAQLDNMLSSSEHNLFKFTIKIDNHHNEN